MLRYRPNDDQLALAVELEDMLERMLPVARLHVSGSESAHAWQSLEDAGVLSAGVSAADGGSELGATERALIAVTLGRCLAAPAVLATMAARPTAERAGTRSARLAVAISLPENGSQLLWAEETEATLLLVRDGERATLHPLPDVTEVVDDGNWGTKLLSGAITVPVATLDQSTLLELRLIEAAALAGIAAGALDLAVAYAKMREQFGRPIGSFQAVKHHCANMAIAARSAYDLAIFASIALDTGRDDAAVQVEYAFLTAAHAAVGNSGTCIQVHGGIGFSAEADPHLYLKRAMLVVAAGGGIETAATRVAGGFS